MTTETSNSKRGDALRPAAARAATGDVPSGPFGVERPRDRDADRGAYESALGTGLMVLYPVAATVVVVLVSLAFGGPAMPA